MRRRYLGGIKWMERAAALSNHPSRSKAETLLTMTLTILNHFWQLNRITRSLFLELITCKYLQEELLNRLRRI